MFKYFGKKNHHASNCLTIVYIYVVMYKPLWGSLFYYKVWIFIFLCSWWFCNANVPIDTFHPSYLTFWLIFPGSTTPGNQFCPIEAGWITHHSQPGDILCLFCTLLLENNCSILLKFLGNQMYWLMFSFLLWYIVQMQSFRADALMDFYRVST